MAIDRFALVAGICLSVALVGCGDEDPANEGGSTGGTSNSTGGTTGDTGGTSGGSQPLPSDDSVDTIAAFVASGDYKQWSSETAEPRDSGSHDEQARIWLNDVAIAGQAEDANNLPVNSMAVKELYTAGEMVGVAAMLKTDEGTNASSWVFYCYGPEGRCSHTEPEYTKEDPLYGRGIDVSCGFCHSTIVTGSN